MYRGFDCIYHEFMRVIPFKAFFQFLLCPIVSWPAFSHPIKAEIKPTNLRCEYRVNPLGVDVPHPRLSWVLESTVRGQRQTAYRVLVASSREKLSTREGDLWDSGKVESDRSMQIAYGGKPLKSKAKVFWKIRAWDRDGNASSWSEPATFQMGLLSRADWKARWIAHPEAVPPAVAARNGYHSQLSNTAEATKWVALDLGRPRTFDGIRLFPARPFDWKPDTPGFLFPLRFRMEVSDRSDFKECKTVVDRTAEDVENPGTDSPSYEFPATTARYIRLVVIRQRLRDANYYGFALAELQVLSGEQNLALGAKATASDSIESANWSATFLMDGDLVSHPANRPEAQPATMARKEFTLPAAVKQATLYITALGLYQVHINGTGVGDHILAPEWTDYHRRVQYQTYDVTPHLRRGKNVLAAILGEGWYAGRIGMSDGIFGVLRRVYGAKPFLLAQLEVELAGGKQITVVSDGSWKATREGPIRSSDILDGEVCDARREMPGWNRPGLDDTAWLPVEVRSDFKTQLVAQPNEPIRVMEELKPVALSEPKPGVYIFDLGQNMVGRCRLQLKGPAGTTVTLRHGEMLNEDGSLYTTNLRSAPQVDRYTLRGGGSEVYEPTFTQHGFRYVELTGLPERPELVDLTGRAFNSSAPEVGRFECSSSMLNQLWKNILWTQRGNLMSTPTDCPQRDERLGWMGDIQVFSQTAIFHMDLAAFFTKWVQDIRDAQAEDGRFPDFAPNPYDPNRRFSGVPAWGDGGVIIPWRCYVNYGDRRMLEEHFESAKRWIEFIRRSNPDLIWRKGRHNDYNDWLNGNTLQKEGWPNRGGAVPNEIFATSFFAHSTELVSKMAKELGREEDFGRYRELFEKIKAAYNKNFVKPDGRIQGDTQAGYALGLHFGLLPEELRNQAAGHMVEGIHRYQKHMSTGIQTTIRLMLELTRNGHNELAWHLLTSRTFPSWGYMIENGATTIWERWDGYVKGRGFQNPGMNSFNHWAFGSVGEWMVRHILGIQPDENHPGYKRFTIHPRPGGGVTWARGSYHSIRGLIASEWKIEKNTFTLNITVPVNTAAQVFLPASDVEAVTEGGRSPRQADGVRFLRLEEETAVFEVGSGSYEFAVPWPPRRGGKNRKGESKE